MGESQINCGALQAVEWSIFDGDQHYETYLDFLKISSQRNLPDYADSVRHALGISYTFRNNEASDALLFIGGIGVLGNIVNEVGLAALNTWRGTGDIDIAVRDPRYLPYVANSFDVVDVDTKSNSVSNKRVVRGWSSDLNNNQLKASDVDIYHPDLSSRPDDGVKVQNVEIPSGYWESPVNVNIFGISLPCLHPVSLLEMKLGIVTNDNIPRNQDIQDIHNLVGVLQRRKMDPAWIMSYLPHKKRDRFKKIIKNGIDKDGQPLLVPYSETYRRHFLS